MKLNSKDFVVVTIGQLQRSTKYGSNTALLKYMEEFTEELRSTSDVNPMHLLQRKALEISNLTYNEAFAIDDSDIAEAVGEFFVTLLVDKFYTKVYDDKELWFRYIFNYYLCR